MLKPEFREPRQYHCLTPSVVGEEVVLDCCERCWLDCCEQGGFLMCDIQYQQDVLDYCITACQEVREAPSNVPQV